MNQRKNKKTGVLKKSEKKMATAFLNENNNKY